MGTQIRKTTDELAAEDIAAGQESDSVAKSAEPTTTTSDGEMKLHHSPEPVETKTSPIKEKKTASPTKILTPAPASGAVQEKTCSEKFSPMLQVECKTPECKRASGKDPSKEDEDNVDEIPAPPKEKARKCSACSARESPARESPARDSPVRKKSNRTTTPQYH